MIDDNDFEDLFLDFNEINIQVEKQRKEEKKMREREEIQQSIYNEYRKIIDSALENVSWAEFFYSNTVEKTVRNYFADRTPDLIKRDKEIEMTEQHYVDACLLALADTADLIKSEIGVIVYKRYSDKIAAALTEKIDSDHNEWAEFSKTNNIYHDEGSNYEGIDPIKLYSNSNVNENIIYWAEREMYFNLSQFPFPFTDDFCYNDKIKYVAHSYFENRTAEEILRDKRALVTEEDYYKWCLEVWKDRDRERDRIIENEQFKTEFEYHNSRFIKYPERSVANAKLK